MSLSMRVTPTKKVIVFPSHDTWARAISVVLGLLALGVLGPWSLDMGIVPLSLQSLVVFSAALLLRPHDFLVCSLGYLIIGAAGLPVFANHSGGIDKLLGHTSGFLWGFVVIGTGLSWTNRRRAMGFPPLLLAALSAHLLLLIPGFTVLYWHLPDAALTSIFLNLFPGLLIKTLIIAVLVNAKQRRSESPVEIAN